MQISSIFWAFQPKSSVIRGSINAPRGNSFLNQPLLRHHDYSIIMKLIKCWYIKYLQANHSSEKFKYSAGVETFFVAHNNTEETFTSTVVQTVGTTVKIQQKRSMSFVFFLNHLRKLVSDQSCKLNNWNSSFLIWENDKNSRRCQLYGSL